MELCTSTGELNFEAVCDNFYLLPDDVKWRSSIGTICAFNHEFVCSTAPYSVICTGTGLIDSLCQLYSAATGSSANIPDRCDAS